MITLARRAADPWSVFDELLSMRGDLNRILDEGVPRGVGLRYPSMNVWASEHDLVVDLELPGVDPKQVAISVRGDELSVSGERRTGESEREHPLRKERFEGRFERTVALPFRVESDKVTAQYRNGVLRITLPRAEADKPKRIEVQAA